eukprot:XP_001706702.1 Hypothetical protein GL50803_19484 [Giardia lamblia ATCC 50803]
MEDSPLEKQSERWCISAQPIVSNFKKSCYFLYFALHFTFPSSLHFLMVRLQPACLWLGARRSFMSSHIFCWGKNLCTKLQESPWAHLLPDFPDAYSSLQSVLWMLSTPITSALTGNPA